MESRGSQRGGNFCVLCAHSSWGLIYSNRSHCRTTALRVKVVERKRGEDCPRPFLLHESVAYWMAANISFTSGVFSFLSAFASIWRIRSRVTERLCPTCSSVQA